MTTECYFRKVKSYTEVIIGPDDSIDIPSFIEATEGLVGVFDVPDSPTILIKCYHNVGDGDWTFQNMKKIEAMINMSLVTKTTISITDFLGSALGVVKADIAGNVAKIRTKHLENPTKFNTLQSIITGEASEKKRTATEGLLWLKRALEFTSLGLRKSKDNSTEELNVSFNAAYGVTLSQFHSFLIRPVFSVAMKACPYRKEFYTKLGDTDPEFERLFEEWLKALERIVAILVALYIKHGLDKGMP
ncbi:hypothetical protein HDU76_013657 [Blyttiomyces sp. JEL0837]|nr:hypothetical protein HDU76_013657 [Blyttiomyces sp. JEL0837]